jgi:hypothetical protein
VVDPFLDQVLLPYVRSMKDRATHLLRRFFSIPFRLLNRFPHPNNGNRARSFQLDPSIRTAAHGAQKYSYATRVHEF